MGQLTLFDVELEPIDVLAELLEFYLPFATAREDIAQLIELVTVDESSKAFAEGYEQGWAAAHESFFETQRWGVEITD